MFMLERSRRKSLKNFADRIYMTSSEAKTLLNNNRAQLPDLVGMFYPIQFRMEEV